MSGSDLFTGTLDILILRAVRFGPLHGYAIGQWIRRESDEVLGVEEGVLYPALHRLHRRGLVESEWGMTDTGRRAKFYRLTQKGRLGLKTETERWTRYTEAVRALLQGTDR